MMNAPRAENVTESPFTVEGYIHVKGQLLQDQDNVLLKRREAEWRLYSKGVY